MGVAAELLTSGDRTFKQRVKYIDILNLNCKRLHLKAILNKQKFDEEQKGKEITFKSQSEFYESSQVPIFLLVEKFYHMT